MPRGGERLAQGGGVVECAGRLGDGRLGAFEHVAGAKRVLGDERGQGGQVGAGAGEAPVAGQLDGEGVGLDDRLLAAGLDVLPGGVDLGHQVAYGLDGALEGVDERLGGDGLRRDRQRGDGALARRGAPAATTIVGLFRCAISSMAGPSSRRPALRMRMTSASSRSSGSRPSQRSASRASAGTTRDAVTPDRPWPANRAAYVPSASSSRRSATT